MFYFVSSVKNFSDRWLKNTFYPFCYSQQKNDILKLSVCLTFPIESQMWMYIKLSEQIFIGLEYSNEASLVLYHVYWLTWRAHDRRALCKQ